MKIAKNKTLAIAIAMLLSFSMTASMMLIPNANAHSPPWNIPTYAYVWAEPNPIGVGQTAHVYMWLDTLYGGGGFNLGAAMLSNNYRFHNYKLVITDPDGTNTTETFAVVTDTTSSQYYQFTPATAGNYTLTFEFPGQVYGADGNGLATSSLVNDTYMPSSASTTLTVQQEPIPVTPGTPLPTSYWDYPIYGQNYGWYTISSNWLGVGTGLGLSVPGPSGYTSTLLYRGDAVGPLTSHIMWTTPTQFGGLVGGNMYPNDHSVGYFEGSSYAPRFQSPIIISGYLYYTQVVSFTGSPILGGSATGPTICVNLRTGQQLWSKMNIPQLSFGYTYDVYDPDQHGVYPPILVAVTGGFNMWAPQLSTPTTWDLFDGFTGDALFNVTNVPSGAVQWGPSGEYLQYIFNNVGTANSPNWYLAQWNSSRLWLYDVDPYVGTGSVSPIIINGTNLLEINVGQAGQLPIPITGELGTLPNGTVVSVPYGSTLIVNGDIGIAEGQAISKFNSPTTYDWNISLPWLDAIPQSYPSNPLTVGAVDYGDMMLCYTTPLPSGFAAMNTLSPYSGSWTMYAINLNASVGAVGSLLWSKTYTPPSGNLTITFGGADWQTRTFVLNYEETMQWVGYSLSNGAQLWGPTESENALSYYGTPGSPPLQAFLAYGNLYSCSYGGVCYAWNDLTGQPVFTYGNGAPGSDNSTYAGFNGPYGVYPTQIQCIANGVVYLATDEHTVTNPIYFGASLTAINATTGQQIWKLSGYPSEWASTGSAWAVAAGYLAFFNGYDGQIYSVGRGPSATTANVQPFGNSVVISGSVIDVSAGTQQTVQKADFPNGVPCASDASMTAWMGYVYQQQAEPTNFTGVPVTISVLDSNGNRYVIGTATTDESGTYSLTWTPNIPGNFTVYAAFAGTNGYWPSAAETHFSASAISATPSPVSTAAPSSMTDTYVISGVIAIIIAIAIVGTLVLLALRKRP